MRHGVVDLPPDLSGAALRRAVYDGAVFRLPADTQRRDVAAHIFSRLTDICGTDPRRVHETTTFAALFPALSILRGDIGTSPESAGFMRGIMAAAGLAPDEVALDALRLRCVMHNGHLSPESERAYALHRDTWFWNPQAQINFWVALHDTGEEESFRFYPRYFREGIANTSGEIGYDDWMRTAGWQGSKSGYSRTVAAYPCVRDGAVVSDADAFSFAARAGDVIVFSAAHLHGTVRNASGRTRFSLDFRAVHRGDHAAGTGAPNADNASFPDALRDYGL